MDQARIRRWRMKAEELRNAAETVNEPVARRGLVSAAATYDALANNAEETERRAAETDHLGQSAAAPRIRPGRIPVRDAQEDVISIGRHAGEQVHELGNLLIGVSFCLRRLRGLQPTAEQEELLQQTMEVTERSVAITGQLQRATSALLRLADQCQPQPALAGHDRQRRVGSGPT